MDFFYEFASTYSYIAAMRIAPIAEAAGLTVRWRPFLLGPIFKAQGWDTSPFNLYPAKGRYMVRDCEREAAANGLTFRLPEPFPQNTLLAARVAVGGLEDGWGEEFSRALYRAQFAEGRQVGDPQVIGEIVDALGQNGAAALVRAGSDDIKQKLRANTEEAQRLGIFGAPSFIADGELFWVMTGWSRRCIERGNGKVGKARYRGSGDARVHARSELERIAGRQVDLLQTRLHVADHVGERTALIVAFDRHHALTRRRCRCECTDERGLARARTTTHEDVATRVEARREEVGHATR